MSGQEQEEDAPTIVEETRRRVNSTNWPGRRPERLLERVPHQTTTTAQLRQNDATCP